MSMFSDYLNELGIKGIVETDRGFATYIINGKECYIEDIYVAPEHRRSNEGTELADKVADKAKALGCTFLTGTIVCSSKVATESCKALIAYGFKISGANNNIICFKKDI